MNTLRLCSDFVISNWKIKLFSIRFFKRKSSCEIWREHGNWMIPHYEMSVMNYWIMQTYKCDYSGQFQPYSNDDDLEKGRQVISDDLSTFSFMRFHYCATSQLLFKAMFFIDYPHVSWCSSFSRPSLLYFHANQLY